MTDDLLTMLQKDVERLETQAAEIPALKANVDSMGREIGQMRTDTADGVRRLEKVIDGLADDGKQSRRVQLGLAITIAGSSLMLVIGLLITFGGKV